MKRFSHWSIATKLLAVNLLVTVIIGAVIAVVVLSFNSIEQKMTTLVRQDVGKVMINAQTGRTLTQVFADTSHLISSFLDRENVLENQGTRLLTITSDLVEQHAETPLGDALQEFLTPLQILIEQATLIRKLSQDVHAHNQTLDAFFSDLKDVIEETQIMAAMTGGDTVALERLVLNIPSYQETLLRINILLNQVIREHLRVLKEGEQRSQTFRQILPLLNDFLVRLQPLTSSENDVAAVGQRIVEAVQHYKTTIAAFWSQLNLFQEQLIQLDQAQQKVLAVMEENDAQIAQATGVMQDTIGRTIASSRALAIGLALVCMLVMLLGWSSMRWMVKPLTQLSILAKRLSKGNVSSVIPLPRSQDEIGQLQLSMKQMAEKIRDVLHETENLIQAAREGRLDARGDETAFQGGWHELVVGINTLIDTFVTPFNVTAEYLDRISKGDIPEKLTEEYKGDFNEMKKNLNLLIQATYETTRIAEEIAEGNLTVEARERSEQDRLMKALNRMIEAFLLPLNTTSKYLARIAQGEIPDKMTAAYKGDFNEIKNNLNALIDATAEVTHVAEEMSGGNLQIEIRERSEHDVLMKSLNDMISRLKVIITNVQSTAANVSMGGQQVSVSAESMTEGVSEQASAAEEASSAMEEMVANIRHNADNSKETEKIALQAAEHAEEGGKVMAEAVVAMRQIAEKILIIEEIAKQTRLLSLNATIEAARAQEHGRAFSVVASEVRKLADITKKAAEEIKQLATSSLDVSTKAGNMLSTLVPSIRKTAELVQEISAASTEQTKGAEHINTAIQRLDQVTQQNAASSEEVSVTAENFAIQAEQLQQAVAFFRSGDTESLEKTSKGGAGDGREAEFEQY